MHAGPCRRLFQYPGSARRAQIRVRSGRHGSEGAEGERSLKIVETTVDRAARDIRAKNFLFWLRLAAHYMVSTYYGVNVEHRLLKSTSMSDREWGPSRAHLLTAVVVNSVKSQNHVRAQPGIIYHQNSQQKCRVSNIPGTRVVVYCFDMGSSLQMTK